MLAIESLGLPVGAEILVPAMTWAATATAVYEANLVPVIVDVTASTGCSRPRLRGLSLAAWFLAAFK